MPPSCSPRRRDSDPMASSAIHRGFRRPAIALAAAAALASPAIAQWDAEPLDASRGGTLATPVSREAAPSASPPAIASSWRAEPGGMPMPVIEAATVVREQHLAVLGGLDSNFEATSAIQIRDPRRGWLPIGSQLANPRAGAAAVALSDGRVLLLGGFAGSVSAPVRLEDGERLDPLVAGSSKPVAPFGQSLEGLSATLLPQDRVLVVAGDAARIYDARLDLWSDPAPLDIARRHHAAIALDETHVLLIGGEVANRPASRPDRLSATLIFVPPPETAAATAPPEAEAFEFFAKAAPPWGLREFSAARHPRDGRWLIAGGLDPSSGTTVQDTWWLDSDRAALRRGPALPLARGACRLHLAAADRGLAILGGEWRGEGARGESDASLLLLAERDRGTEWRRLAPLPDSSSRRMLVGGAQGIELIGGYAFLDAETAAAMAVAPGPRFDPRRYRLSIAPLAAGD